MKNEDEHKMNKLYWSAIKSHCKIVFLKYNCQSIFSVTLVKQCHEGFSLVRVTITDKQPTSLKAWPHIYQFPDRILLKIVYGSY